MIAITGCPRSGTSLMMDLMRVALGDDRIVGSKWPREVEGQDEATVRCVEHIKDRRSPGWREDDAETKEMNPNGFYECAWTVRGIKYTPDPPPSNHAVKIVSQGLAASNPQYIDKIVYMVRHPWAVAKSQNDLILNAPVRARNRDIGGAGPRMYVNVTAAAAAWIDRHKPSVLLVNFDELIGNPDESLARVAEFIGEGAWDTAKQQIEPKYRRNEPERGGDGDLWDVSVDLHDLLLRGDWPRIVERHKEYAEAQPRQTRFFCTRWGGSVNRAICEQCQSDATHRRNFIETANKRKIDWQNEPCLWECGMNPDRDTYTPLTIDESIARNHWVTESRGLGDTIAKATKAVGIKPCGGCKKRQAALNRAVPYKRSEK